MKRNCNKFIYFPMFMYILIKEYHKMHTVIKEKFAKSKIKERNALRHSHRKTNFTNKWRKKKQWKENRKPNRANSFSIH
jgi:hypothetical protein